MVATRTRLLNAQGSTFQLAILKADNSTETIWRSHWLSAIAVSKFSCTMPLKSHASWSCGVWPRGEGCNGKFDIAESGLSRHYPRSQKIQRSKKSNTPWLCLVNGLMTSHDTCLKPWWWWQERYLHDDQSSWVKRQPHITALSISRAVQSCDITFMQMICMTTWGTYFIVWNERVVIYGCPIQATFTPTFFRLFQMIFLYGTWIPRDTAHQLPQKYHLSNEHLKAPRTWYDGWFHFRGHYLSSQIMTLPAF